MVRFSLILVLLSLPLSLVLDRSFGLLKYVIALFKKRTTSHFGLTSVCSVVSWTGRLMSRFIVNVVVKL